LRKHCLGEVSRSCIEDISLLGGVMRGNKEQTPREFDTQSARLEALKTDGYRDIDKAPRSLGQLGSQYAWRIVLDFHKKCSEDATEGKQLTTMVYEAPHSLDQSLFSDCGEWLRAIEQEILDALSQVGLNAVIMPTLAVKAGDLVEPDQFPWWVRIGSIDAPVNYPLPGPAKRSPWGLVNQVDESGNAYCTIATVSGDRTWEQIKVKACVMASDLTRLRPKRTPTVDQMLATPTLEELLAEFPMLQTFLKSKGADFMKCSQAWRLNDVYIRNLVKDAHNAKVFLSSSADALPWAVVLSRKTSS